MLYYSIIFFYLILSENLIQILSYNNRNYEDDLIRRKKAALLRNFKWKLPIKYFVHSFLKDQRAVEEAIKRIQNKTCIKFEREYWYIKGTKGFNILPTYYYCSSSFGPKLNDENYENNILVSPKCQNSVGMVEELIGKMLGLLNEVDRPDRDNYIKINYENINYKSHTYFHKYNPKEVKKFETGYDFLSASHFFPKNFSKNDRPVIEPKDSYTNYKYSMGQNNGLSFNDYKVLALRYCNSKYNFGCENYGYRDPKMRSKCICPSGFTGESCEFPIENPRLCNQSELQANNNTQQIFIINRGNCSYFIRSENKEKIKLTIISSKTEEKEGCSSGMGVEVKYRIDKGVEGVSLCGTYENITFTSEGNFMVIIYNGLKSSNKFVANYVIKNSTNQTP